MLARTAGYVRTVETPVEIRVPNEARGVRSLLGEDSPERRFAGRVLAGHVGEGPDPGLGYVAGGRGALEPGVGVRREAVVGGVQERGCAPVVEAFRGSGPGLAPLGAGVSGPAARTLQELQPLVRRPLAVAVAVLA